MTMRTWLQEGESICIYPFTRLYKNGISVGIRYGRHFQISPFWIFVKVAQCIKRARISTLSQCKCIRVIVALITTSDQSINRSVTLY